MPTRNQLLARQSPPPESLHSRSGRGDGSSRLAGRPGTSSHTLWHHLAMVIYSEVINFLWLITAVFGIAGGIIFFNLTESAFFKMAVGLPLITVFSGVVLFKIHEIVLVLFRPQRLKAMCRFCREE